MSNFLEKTLPHLPPLGVQGLDVAIIGGGLAGITILNAVLVEHGQIDLQHVPAWLDSQNLDQQIKQVMSSLKRDVCLLKSRLEIFFCALLTMITNAVVVWFFAYTIQLTRSIPITFGFLNPFLRDGFHIKRFRVQEYYG